MIKESEANGAVRKIDVLFVYSSRLEELKLPEQIAGLAGLAVQDADDAFQLSDVRCDVESVGLFKTSTKEKSDDISSALLSLQAPCDTSFDDVLTERDRVKADVVCFLGVFNGQAGKAFRLQSVDSETAFEAYAFMAMHHFFAANPGHYTFTHELGHIFGCCHSAADANMYKSFAVGHSFDVGTVKYRTLMMPFSTETRILHFSNPNVSFPPGGASGAQPTGVMNVSDCAATIRASAGFVENFRK